MIKILIGLPNSGKSDWAKKQGLPIISASDVRKELNLNMNQNKHVLFPKLKKMLSEYEGDVIFDATNLSERDRHGFEGEYHVFFGIPEDRYNIPMERAYRRIELPEKYIPHYEIENKMLQFDVEYKSDYTKYYEQDDTIDYVYNIAMNLLQGKKDNLANVLEYVCLSLRIPPRDIKKIANPSLSYHESKIKNHGDTVEIDLQGKVFSNLALGEIDLPSFGEIEMSFQPEHYHYERIFKLVDRVKRVLGYICTGEGTIDWGCETSTYLSDVESIGWMKTENDYKKVVIRKLEGYGFSINGEFVAAYHSSNGYYSSDMDLYFETPEGEFIHLFEVPTDNEVY